jgi:hypothetical protein
VRDDSFDYPSEEDVFSGYGDHLDSPLLDQRLAGNLTHDSLVFRLSKCQGKECGRHLRCDILDGASSALSRAGARPFSRVQAGPRHRAPGGRHD